MNANDQEPVDPFVIGRAELSEEVRGQRERDAVVEQRNTEALAGRVERHLAMQKMLTARMAGAHQAFVDETNFDPSQMTRQAAAWLAAGRCLGYAGSITAQLAEGFTVEVDPTARALEEASRLIPLLLDPEEPVSWKLWKRGTWMKIKDLDKAEKAQRERNATAVLRQGYAPPGPTQELSKQLYANLSETAHPQRSNIELGWHPGTRRYLHGPQARTVNRAAWIYFGDEWVRSAYVAVGDCLIKLQPSFKRIEYLERVVKPGLDDLAQLTLSAPLDPASLQAMGGGFA